MFEPPSLYETYENAVESLKWHLNKKNALFFYVWRELN